MFIAMLIRIASVVLTLAGVLALALGIFHWLGAGANLIALHMLLGLLAVGALWVIGVAQAFSKEGAWTIAAGALVVGALTVALGFRQAALLVGEFHWIIQAAHALLGVLAIGIGHMGAARSRKGQAN
jgi:hypothetical protein